MEEIKKIKPNDRIKFHFTLSTVEGESDSPIITQVESSEGNNKSPLEVVLGQGSLIKGLEESLIGLPLGESPNPLLVSAAQGYGEYLDGLVGTLDPKQFPDTVKVGDILQSEHPQRGTMTVRVIEIDDKYVKVDANHPLAGKNLLFEVKIMEIM